MTPILFSKFAFYIFDANKPKTFQLMTNKTQISFEFKKFIFECGFASTIHIIAKISNLSYNKIYSFTLYTLRMCVAELFSIQHQIIL